MSDAAWSWKAGKGNNSGIIPIRQMSYVIRRVRYTHIYEVIYLECVQKYRVSYIGFNSF